MGSSPSFPGKIALQPGASRPSCAGYRQGRRSLQEAEVRFPGALAGRGGVSASPVPAGRQSETSSPEHRGRFGPGSTLNPEAPDAGEARRPGPQRKREAMSPPFPSRCGRGAPLHDCRLTLTTSFSLHLRLSQASFTVFSQTLFRESLQPFQQIRPHPLRPGPAPPGHAGAGGPAEPARSLRALRHPSCRRVALLPAGPLVTASSETGSLSLFFFFQLQLTLSIILY